MNINKIILGGLIGGVVALILGFVFYGVLLTDFFSSNAGSATGVMRADDEMLWGPMIIGHVAWGVLFAYIFERWANISTFVGGAKAGAVIAVLVSLTYNMINLATTHVMNLTGALVDVVVMALVAAVTAGTVAWSLGRK